MKNAIKSALTLILSLAICFFTFLACDNKENTLDSNNTDNATNVPSENELLEMYNRAVNYEKNGKFKSAINIYRELYSYGFTDPAFGDNGKEKALEIRERRYLLSSIVCKYLASTVGSLKSKLKDPNSLVVYSIQLYESTGNTFVITLDYGAKNSFGGMVRDDYTSTYTLPTYEQEKIYSSSKESMDRIGCTTARCAEYLAGNCLHLFEDTVYEAIVNGTYDY